jgi:hypothetical protein
LRLNSELEFPEFRLKAFALSKGTKTHMWEVTPQAFEYGEDVIDTETGKLGQVRFIVWDCKHEIWLYCISRKDIDNEEAWVKESRLKRAPAQTRIDKAGKTILYAPRKLKHQQRLAPYVKRVSKLDRFGDYYTRPLSKFTKTVNNLTFSLGVQNDHFKRWKTTLLTEGNASHTSSEGS